MKTVKKIFVGLLIAAIFGGIIAGMVWYSSRNVMVGFRFYPRNQEVLDLRDQEVSQNLYDQLSRRLPGTLIRWNIPFQGLLYPDTTDQLTLTQLSRDDVYQLKYFTALTSVNADQCQDYENLLFLTQERPDLSVRYLVPVNGEDYLWDTTRLVLDDVSEEDISLLHCLPKLKSVAVSSGRSQHLATLQEYCRKEGLSFEILIAGDTVSDDVTSLTLKGVTDEELALLSLMNRLKSLHIQDPKASAANLQALQVAQPDLKLSWDVTIWGLNFPHDFHEEEVDLSAGNPTTLEAVEKGMEYLPEAKQVFLGECGLDNEKISQFRERSREKYKVVWTVRFGGKLPTRTDRTDFFPSRDGMYHFDDSEAVNLKYCEDMVCIDVGHMTLKDTSFLAYMPDLEYLILAHTEVQRIDAISNCKKLKFLELDWSCCRSLEGLQGCTSLEDLNIGMVWPDVTPILGMTWIKNIWIIHGSSANAAKLAQALPDTRIVASGELTVSSGWRRLPNYYAMRDYLGVPYMSG